MDPALPQDPAELLAKAREAKREAAVEGTLFFAGIALGGVIVARKAPGLGHALVEFASFKFTPKSAFSFAKPGIAALLYAAPAPLGVIPPEEYGISPDYLAPLLPDFALRETIGTKGTPLRRAAFELQEFRDYLANYERVGRSKRAISNRELQLLYEQYAALGPNERVGEFLTANLALFGIQQYAQQNGLTLTEPQVIHSGHLEPVNPADRPSGINAAIGASGVDQAQQLQRVNPPDP